MLKVTFDNKQNLFFKELKDKVDHYFLNRKLDPAGGRRLYLKGIVQVLSAIGLYVTLVFFTPGMLLAIVLLMTLLRRSAEQVETRLSRHASLGPYAVTLNKTIGLERGSGQLEIAYELEALPQ